MGGAACWQGSPGVRSSASWLCAHEAPALAEVQVLQQGGRSSLFALVVGVPGGRVGAQPPRPTLPTA